MGFAPSQMAMANADMVCEGRLKAPRLQAIKPTTGGRAPA